MTLTYEAAMKKMNQHITQKPDGTFELAADADSQNLGIDLVVFADLKRSLEITNGMIRSGKINAADVEFPTPQP